MHDFSHLPSLEKVIEAHGLLARKSLGQHFLLDGAMTDEIVRYAGDITQCNVIEIGSGPGGLTRSLLKAGAKKVYAIEKDERCIAALASLKKAAGNRLEIIHGDALEVDLMQAVPPPRKIAANLPYNAGTAMLLQWLDMVYNSSLRAEGEAIQNAATNWIASSPAAPRNDGAFQSLTLMFQKEVAERITAVTGTKDYGRLSVLCQWLCDCRYDFELPPMAFTPPPKVTSAVVTLTPRPKPLADVSKETLEAILAKAFGQRRKMLRQALKGLPVPADKLLNEAGIDGSLRAERLDVATFCYLAKAYQNHSS